MRRGLLAVGATAIVGLRVARRRMREASATVVVGLADGSALDLERGSAERDELLALARRALAA